MDRVAIRIEALSKRFKSGLAVDHLDLRIVEGEIFGLLGPNGAGKTTTIQMILGLSAPSAGVVEVLGLNPSKRPQRVRTVTGVVMQQSALDIYLTGRENLMIYADLFNMPRHAKVARAGEVLSWVGLQNDADRLVKTYSGGMKRRLDLAIGILHHPKLLVLDEPTLGLDIQTRRQLWKLIGQMRDAGTTVLLTTHYLEEANSLCDRVGIMDQGRLVGLDTPEALRRNVVGDLHRLTVKVSVVPDLAKLDLPLSPTRSQNQLVFSGSPKKLWKALAKLQRCCGETILEVNYTQPSLDDVFLRLTQGDSNSADKALATLVA
jgi:ABC-2 type transport system ATP-binding protein